MRLLGVLIFLVLFYNYNSEKNNQINTIKTNSAEINSDLIKSLDNKDEVLLSIIGSKSKSHKILQSKEINTIINTIFTKSKLEDIAMCNDILILKKVSKAEKTYQGKTESRDTKELEKDKLLHDNPNQKTLIDNEIFGLMIVNQSTLIDIKNTDNNLSLQNIEASKDHANISHNDISNIVGTATEQYVKINNEQYKILKILKPFNSEIIKTFFIKKDNKNDAIMHHLLEIGSNIKIKIKITDLKTTKILLEKILTTKVGDINNSAILNLLLSTLNSYKKIIAFTDQRLINNISKTWQDDPKNTIIEYQKTFEMQLNPENIVKIEIEELQ